MRRGPRRKSRRRRATTKKTDGGERREAQGENTDGRENQGEKRAAGAQGEKTEGGEARGEKHRRRRGPKTTTEGGAAQGENLGGGEADAVEAQGEKLTAESQRRNINGGETPGEKRRARTPEEEN
jgi:hypothetical protein